jgi:hypothetical protein
MNSLGHLGGTVTTFLFLAFFSTFLLGMANRRLDSANCRLSRAKLTSAPDRKAKRDERALSDCTPESGRIERPADGQGLEQGRRRDYAQDKQTSEGGMAVDV